MPVVAQLFAAVILSLGLAVLLQAAGTVEITRPGLFLFYAAGAVSVSVFRMYLPGVAGTTSVNFLFVLFAIIDLSAEEAALIAAVAVAVQYVFLQVDELTPAQAAFNTASISVAVAVSASVHQLVSARMPQLEAVPAACLTAATFFLLNTYPVAFMVGISERRPGRDIWRRSDLSSVTYYLAGAALIVIIGSAGAVIGWQTSLLAVPSVFAMHRAYRFYVERRSSERAHAREMAGLHMRTIEALALAIEAKDHTTHEHLHRVRVYAMELARDLQLTQEQTDALHAAALLHDIGKLAVPEHITSKPGKLTPEEFEKMKIHPIIGAEILDRIGFPYPVVPIVAAHHERWDGAGYPYGLSGNDIPVGARILAAVDCLDALASDRQYRSALPLDEAMAVVREQAGKAFDPAIVELLERRYVQLDALARESTVEKPRVSRDVRMMEDAPTPFRPQQSGRPVLRARSAQPGFLKVIASARDEVQALIELSQAIGNSLSVSDTLCVVAQHLLRLVPYDGLAVRMIDGSTLNPVYVTGRDSELFRSLVIPVGQGVSGRVAENGKYILNGSPSLEGGYAKAQRFSTMQSALCVPLDGTSERLGVFTVYRNGRNQFTSDDLRIVMAVMAKVGVALENAIRFVAAEADAVKDHLTGLPNGRSLFVYLEEQIGQAVAARSPLTVLVGDLDGFKHINDTYGHLEGNELLRAIACCLQSHCRDIDYVARLGGDEFVLVLPGLETRAGNAVAGRIAEAVAETSRARYGQALVTLSVGAATLDEQTRTAKDLLAAADGLMYLNKRAGKRSPVGVAGSLVRPESSPKRATIN